MRHLRSILYALVLGPAVWILSGVGLTQDLTGRARDAGGSLETITAALLLLLAGTGYAILLLSPLSPAGPTLTGLIFLGVGLWGLTAPDSYAGVWPAGVTREGFDLSRPGYALAVLLAVPLLCTALSARRWARYEPPELPLIGTLGRARGKAAVAGTPIAAERTTLISSDDHTQVIPPPADAPAPPAPVPARVSPPAEEATTVLRTGGSGQADEPTTVISRAEEPTAALSAVEEPTTTLVSAEEPTTLLSRDGEPTPPRSDEPTAGLGPTGEIAADEPTTALTDRDEPSAETDEPTTAATQNDDPIAPIAEADEPTAAVAIAEADEPTVAVTETNEPTVAVAEADQPTTAIAETGAAAPPAVAATPSRDTTPSDKSDLLDKGPGAAEEATEPLTPHVDPHPDDEEKTQVIRLAAARSHDTDHAYEPGTGETTRIIGPGERTQIIARPQLDIQARAAAQAAHDRAAQERARQAFRDRAAQERARQAFDERAAQEAREHGEQTQAISVRKDPAAVPGPRSVLDVERPPDETDETHPAIPEQRRPPTAEADQP
ncbi:hypothetical protein [Jidongwangia harbinensis]|uniref:hypothetical protein n=1 Tax=Jidongwangia harbinensis TaxID=2878561 RepID=UPI001CD96C8E|nr:hypothetical protein [Jidongwangia harbinensis]MCA2215599.1 hypothetical protein [Jidongwangia harbinensis]